jgi:RNA polymerase sigma factor (sigma-70 family)
VGGLLVKNELICFTVPKNLFAGWLLNLNFLNPIPDPSHDDQELLARYKQSGDLGALASLYHRYIDLVYAVCLKYLKEPERSKDAVMNIFEELISKLKKHEVTHFRGWLYTTARNHCLMQLRSGSQVKFSEFDPNRMQISESLHLNGILEKEVQLNQLEHCLEALSEEQKTTVRLFYFQNKCYKEIGEITGMDSNKVRSQIQNGRRNLKICMEGKALSSH